MSEPNIVVTDDVKTIHCGEVLVRLYLGKFPYVRLHNECPAEHLPDLIQALHTAQDIAAARKEDC